MFKNVIPLYFGSGQLPTENPALNLNLSIGVLFFIPSVIIILLARMFPQVKRDIYFYFLAQMYFIMTHFFFSVNASGLSTLSEIRTLVLIFAVVQLLVTVRSAAIFLGYTILCGFLLNGNGENHTKISLFVGECIMSVIALSSIADKRRIYKMFSDSEKMARTLLHEIPTPTWTLNEHGQCDYMNPMWTVLTGQTEKAALGDGYAKSIHPEDNITRRKKSQAARQKKEPYQNEFRIRCADGSYKWVICNTSPRYSIGGQFLGYTGILTDITVRREMEEQRRLSEERTRMAVDATGVATWYYDLKTNKVTGSAQYFKHLGLPEDTPYILYKELNEKFVYPDDVKNLEETANQAIIDKKGRGLEFRMISAGEIKWFDSYTTARFDKKGDVIAFIGTTIDITKRKLAEIEARKANEAITFAREAGNLSTWEMNLLSSEIVITMGDKLTGKSRTFARTLEEYYKIIHPEDLQNVKQAFEQAVLSRSDYEFTYRVRGLSSKECEYEWVLNRGKVYSDKNGVPVRAIGIALNITEIKRLSRELKDKNDIFVIALKAAKIAYWDWNPKTNHVIFDEDWFKQIDILDKDSSKIDNWMAALHPDDSEMVSQKINDHLAGKTENYEALMRLMSKSGKYKYVLAKGKILERDEEGTATKFAGVHVDLTELWLLKEKIEEQRRQLADSAKLASLGVLAAGVAHEINNSLNFINGSLSSFKKIINEFCPLNQREHADQMISVMESGLNISMNVVKSLNSSTSSSQAKFIDVGIKESIEGVLTLTRSRMSNLAVVVDVPGDIKIWGSVSGFSQIFMNLFLNASDAMGGSSGEIRVSALNRVKDGQEFVEITVKDNGCGMTDEVKRQVFDPFFTTKDVGRGSGLGMFVVKNEIDKHYGSISIGSELGNGTTYKIIIPRQAKAKAA